MGRWGSQKRAIEAGRISFGQKIAFGIIMLANQMFPAARLRLRRPYLTAVALNIPGLNLSIDTRGSDL